MWYPSEIHNPVYFTSRITTLLTVIQTKQGAKTPSYRYEALSIFSYFHSLIMDANQPPRMVLQILPNIRFLRVDNERFALAAFNAIQKYIGGCEAPFARQTASCNCNGSHNVIVSSGYPNISSLGNLFFLVSPFVRLTVKTLWLVILSVQNPHRGLLESRYLTCRCERAFESVS